MLDEYLHSRRFEKNERAYFDDIITGISNLQELKNEYFKNNIEYQRLLNKNLLATQIDFSIQNISYSSLGFDLSLEPIDKLVQLFDNNFELFRIFLDTYIAEDFLASLSYYSDDNFPLSVFLDYPQSFKEEFNTKVFNTKSPDAYNSTNEQIKTKRDKAKWAWSLANGSLFIPVILSLVILYIAISKIDKLNEIHQDNFNRIQTENDKLIDNYHRLIELQIKTYNDLIIKRSAHETGKIAR